MARRAKPGATNPASIMELLGSPPLLDDEDPALYEEFAAIIRAKVAPRNVIEEIYCRDFTAYHWELEALRKRKVELINSARPQGLKTVLGGDDCEQGHDYFLKWAHGDAYTKEHARLELKKMGLSDSAISSAAFEVKLDTIERIDRLVGQVEARRNRILREISRYRRDFADALRDAIYEEA